MSELIFLGTGGARVVVFKQVLASGGLWLKLESQKAKDKSGEINIHIDPGPGALIQALKRKLQPDKLDAIILSHKHLDHSADINVMIEAMTGGGFKPRGTVFAPEDALEGEDPVIFRYLRSYPKKIEILKPGVNYQVGEVEFTCPVRHVHGTVETYGLKFAYRAKTISYIADTRFFEDLSNYYAADLMIFNVVRLEKSELDHLCIPEVKQIIEVAKPKVAIITHFGMTVWRARPWELAAKLSQETGLKIVAARDGLRVNLDEI